MKKNLLTITLFTVILFFNCKKTSNNTPQKTQTPVLVSSKEGKTWNVLGVKITGKIISQQSNGAYAVIITETPPEGGPPMHIHKNEDELFYVLKGNYTFVCGKEKIKAKTGDFIRLPRGIPHRFINTDTITGITMNTITPGGFEKFFDEIAETSKKQQLSRKEISDIANKYGVSFVKN